MKPKYILWICAICIALTSLLILAIPHAVDYYINSNAEGNIKIYTTNEIIKQNQNYIVQGSYNGSNIIIDSQGNNFTLDRQLNHTLLYKECSHQNGDAVRYFGVFYDTGKFNPMSLLNVNEMRFAIKRELC